MISASAERRHGRSQTAKLSIHRASSESMHDLGRLDATHVPRAQNEAEKAIRFASLHGEWPLDLSPAAGRALARRPDSDELERRWGNLVEAVLDG